MRLVNDAVSDTGSNPTGALTMGPHGGPSPWVYEGGETRLVAVRRYCSYRELLDGLTKVAVNAPTLTVRYELPSDPSVLVDVVNDDDVALMFSELDEVAAEVAAAAVAHGRPVGVIGGVIGSVVNGFVVSGVGTWCACNGIHKKIHNVYTTHLHTTHHHAPAPPPTHYHLYPPPHRRAQCPPHPASLASRSTCSVPQAAPHPSAVPMMGC